MFLYWYNHIKQTEEGNRRKYSVKIVMISRQKELKQRTENNVLIYYINILFTT